jgi:hypothetical protein
VAKVQEKKLNLGQYTSDLISLANRLQKEAAGVNEPLKIYHLVVEIKDKAKELQNHIVEDYLQGREHA